MSGSARVVGGGPAGVVVARILAERGWTVVVHEPRPDGSGRPQRAHVHVCTEATVEAFRRWLPALPADWRRTELEAVLRDVPGVRVVAEPATDAQLDAAELVVDASGAARATLPWVAAQVGRSVPLDMTGTRRGYASVVLEGVAWSGPPLQVARADGLGVLACREGARARVTVQGDGPLPRTWDAVREVVASVLDGPLLDGAPVGKVVHAAGGRVRRLALEEVDGLPPGWLAVGDALVQTPPAFAGGLGQVVWQASRLEAGLDAGEPIGAIRRALSEQAARWWSAAIVRQALPG